METFSMLSKDKPISLYEILKKAIEEKIKMSNTTATLIFGKLIANNTTSSIGHDEIAKKFKEKMRESVNLIFEKYRDFASSHEMDCRESPGLYGLVFSETTKQKLNDFVSFLNISFDDVSELAKSKTVGELFKIGYTLESYFIRVVNELNNRFDMELKRITSEQSNTINNST